MKELKQNLPAGLNAHVPVQGLAASNDYEDKKLKMRKAMGESLHDAPVNESETAEERRLNTIRCAPWRDQS